jgi:hypothetical protein
VKLIRVSRRKPGGKLALELNPEDSVRLDGPLACAPISRQGMKTQGLSIPTNPGPKSALCWFGLFGRRLSVHAQNGGAARPELDFSFSTNPQGVSENGVPITGPSVPSCVKGLHQKAPYLVRSGLN